MPDAARHRGRAGPPALQAQADRRAGDPAGVPARQRGTGVSGPPVHVRRDLVPGTEGRLRGRHRHARRELRDGAAVRSSCGLLHRDDQLPVGVHDPARVVRDGVTDPSARASTPRGTGSDHHQRVPAGPDAPATHAVQGRMGRAPIDLERGIRIANLHVALRMDADQAVLAKELEIAGCATRSPTDARGQGEIDTIKRERYRTSSQGPGRRGDDRHSGEGPVEGSGGAQHHDQPLRARTTADAGSDQGADRRRRGPAR